jgi:anaerobic nitric oxide reductase flavorubredoxin
VLVGTSTMNNVMMPKIAGLVEEMTGLRFRNKRASAFGSHGWSGGAVDRLSTRLQDAGFEMSLSLKAKWRPDLDALELCREHGREIARQWALSRCRSPQPNRAGTGKLRLCRSSRSRPVDAVQRLPVGLRSGERRTEPGCPAGDAVERGPG